MADMFPNTWLDESSIIPVNGRPDDGLPVVAGDGGVEMSVTAESQALLSRYGYGAWLWVRLEPSTIPNGSHRGHPTFDVWLDGVRVGWFGYARVKGRENSLPVSGAWLVAHIPDRRLDRDRDRFALRVRMPAVL